MRFLTIVAIGIALTNLAEAAVTIIGISNDIETIVSDHDTGFDTDIFVGTNIPTSQLLESTFGDGFSRVQINYSEADGQTVFSYGIAQNRSGGYSDSSQAFNSALRFSVDVNSTYELSGWFSATDMDEPGTVAQVARLFDEFNNAFLFNNSQGSEVAPNESFVLGEEEGDYFNNLSGSLTGNLSAGNTYWLFWNYFIQAVPEADAGASAVGNLTLVIDAVPEPTTCGLALAATLLFAIRYRRTHARAR